MKKVGKLLAIALSVIILIAIVCVSVFAAEGTGGKKYANFMLVDYESHQVGANAALADETRWGTFTVRETDNGSNKYVEYNYKTSTGNTNLFEIGCAKQNTLDQNNGYTYSIAEYPYIVIDFDAMTETGTFSNSVTFYPFEKVAALGANGIRTENGNSAFSGYSHCPSFSESGTFGPVNLNTTPYAWNHITMVWEFNINDNCTAATWDVHYYLDGEYVTSVPNAGKTKYEIDDLAFAAIRAFRINTSKENTDENISTCLDNIQMTYYTKDFGSYGDMVKNIYNKDYPLPYGKTVASIGEKKYDSIQKAFADCLPGETLVLWDNVTAQDGIVIDKEIVVDTNKADGSGTYDFVYSASLVGVAENGIVSFVKMENSSVSVFWDDCLTCVCPDAIGEDHYKKCPTCTCPNKGHALYAESVDVFLNAVPTYPGELPGPVVDDNGVSYQFVGWSYDSNATEPEEIVAISQDDVNSGVGYISIFPVYSTIKYAVGVVDANNEIRYYTADQMATAIANAPNKSRVIFYQDYIANKSITISNKEITFDLNGYDIRVSSTATNLVTVTAVDAAGKETTTTTYDTTNKPSAFGIGAKANLTVTSSKPGAGIYVSTILFSQKVNLDGSKDAPVYQGVNGSAVFSVSGADSAITILGENLSTYSSELIDVWKPAANLLFTVKGGNYYRTVADYSGLINNRFAATMNFEDAQFITTVGTLVYVWDNTYKHNVESYSMSFKNCTFQCPDNRGAFALFGEECTVTFTDCIFGAGFYESNAATVIMEGNCVFEKDIPKDAILPDGTEFVEYPTSVNVDYAYNVFKTTDDHTAFADSSYTELVPVKETRVFKRMIADADGFVATVNWVDPNGALISTSTVLKNTVATPPEATIPYGDGWRNVKIKDWKNKNGEINYNIGEENEYTFTAVIPAVEDAEFTGALTGALHNISWYAHFGFNVYIPATEGVTITKTNYTNYGIVYIDGAPYYRLGAFPSTVTAARDYTMNLEYEIDGKTYKCNFTLGIIYYANAILKDEKSTPEEINVIKNMLRYIDVAYKTVGSTPTTAFQALVNNNPAPAYATEYPDKDVDYSAVEEYIEKIELGINTNQARYIFTLTEAAKAAGIKVTTSAFTIEEQNGGAAFITKNTRVYDLTKSFTFNIVDANGEILASCTYSAGAYINATGAEIAKATYAFAEAVNTYKASLK